AADGYDVHDGESLDRIRLVQGQPVGAARPAVVRGDPEPVETEAPHHLELVVGDRAHAVGLVVGRARRLAAFAVPPQIAGDHRVVLGELRRHPVPHEMRLRNAVQQQHRRAAAAAYAVDPRTGRLNVELFEPVEHDPPTTPDIAPYTYPARACFRR